MNFKDLANLDVKDIQNLDFQAIFNELKKKPDVIIEILVVLTTIIICTFLYVSTSKNTVAALKQIRDLEGKVEVYEKFMKVKNSLNSLKEVLPDQISEAGLIEAITKTAERYQIDINSFSPASEQEKDAYSKLSLTIRIKASSYKDLWKFIYDLENTLKTIKIESWNVSLQDNNPRFYRSNTNISDNKDMPMGSSMKISIINYKK